MSNKDFPKSYEKSRELCFDENEFLKDTFSVDIFLREHRNKASLEVMRDDLGTHLKSLRLSMIELINKDYEDFVNLSKDLVGLDNGIRKIQTPLQDIKNEVLGVKNELVEAISGFTSCLEQHKKITTKKRSLIHVSQVITCINKLKSIIGSCKANHTDYSIDLIERATMEFNQLQFSLSKCEGDLQETQKKEADVVSQKLMSILNNKFLECLKEKKSCELVKTLKMYAGLDKVNELELLVRQEVIAPKLATLITEEALQREPDGLSYVYDEIIYFIETELNELLLATSYKGAPPPLKGYNFMVNSLWPELEKRLNLPLMFAPGNANLFHSRFTKSNEFLRKLEILCGSHSSIIKLREDRQYQYFIQKWNLPVYFKIRFQEIAGQLEKSLGEVKMGGPVSQLKSETAYYLKSSSVVIEQIKKCWRNDVYLPELSHMFWKLSLQILSRYRNWLTECLSKESDLLAKRRMELGTLQTSFGLDNFQVKSRLDFLVCLFSDTNTFLTEARTFLERSKEKIPNKHLVEEELSISLEESLGQVRETIPKMTDSIVNIIVSESAVHLRQVSQIPRLFRRTNRKSSTEPCEYIGQVLNFPKQFFEWKSNQPFEVLENWFTLAFNEMTNLFYAAVNEVLTNAQKTEESLRKLKKKKENYPSKNSGDDEIRQQLVIDVHSFSDELQRFQVKKENIQMLKDLVELVETARNKSEKQ
ncbi:hypothetical protein RUM44_013520 [Polyplax serrata]|uniref:Conserved oligomeric Golgi complex subunit 2 n=1 Tax=Polyplax serrata TaxID=468196 RepID=A0ABR1BEE3_POLSC